MFQNFQISAPGGDRAEQLRALRGALAEAGFDGLLVPRADAHQGEVVPPGEERLAWLSGFTGSAGLAIVLGERAALCVDGRYTLQAAEQVDTALYEIVASHDTRPEDWLAAAVGEGTTIGYDPWLHGRAEIARFEAALAGTGAALAPVETNPIDRLWQDRPPQPMAAVRIHPEALTGASAESKRRRLGAALGDTGADAAVLTLPDSIAWLLNIRGGDLSHTPVALGFAVLYTDGRVTLHMDPDKFDSPVLAHLGGEVALEPPARLAASLDALTGRRVRLDERTCPPWIADRLEQAGATLDWGEDPCLLPKACKTEVELDGFRAAHRRDGAAMVRFLHWLETQAEAGAALTEIAVIERLEALRVATGRLEDIAFDTICGAGPHGAIVHYRVTRQTDRALAPGEIVLVDSGGQYRDGTTDITRTVAFGPVEAAAVRPFTLVLKGMIAISRARWPEGLAGRDLDPLARAALWRAGLDYDHGTGHGVGAYLNVHEGPAALSRRSGGVALRPGMVLSNEPGYYRAGAFGIRIENLVTVTGPAVPKGGERAMLGFETLTLCPIERRLIDPALLDADERGWLDAYHARVREVLSAELEAEPRAWLARACAPLEAAA